MKIVEEESDETLYWLELLRELPGIGEAKLQSLNFGRRRADCYIYRNWKNRAK